MPGIANQLIASKTPGMLGDQRAIGHDADLGGGAAHRDRPTGKRCRNAVAVAIQHNDAGAGDPQHMFHIPVEGRGDPPQDRLLLGEAVGDQSIRGHGVLALRQLPASHGQPLV